MEKKPKENNTPPLVSIITIVLNGEEVLRKTIESIINQSYPLIEYIIIDGGSTDKTVDIIKEYDTRIAYWSSAHDKGISDAFNKGITQAHGEVIGLLNAGDWYEIDTVQNVINAFTKSQNIDVVCGALQFWREGKREYLCQSEPELLERDMSITHPTCFLTRNLYNSVGVYSNEYQYAMDYELLLRVRNSGASFLALEKTLANMPHDGLSEVNWKAALYETHRARRKILKNSFFTTSLYYYFLYSKRQIRVLLEHLKWDAVIRTYRAKFALVKKTK